MATYLKIQSQWFAFNDESSAIEVWQVMQGSKFLCRDYQENAEHKIVEKAVNVELHSTIEEKYIY